MKQLDKQIKWYEKKWKGFDKQAVLEELETINELYDITDFDNNNLVEKVITNFCEIIEEQREKIHELEMKIENEERIFSRQHNFIAFNMTQNKNFESDEQLQKAFQHYLTHEVKKPLSSYTVNDYCSRIKNFWNMYYDSYKEDGLPEQLFPTEEDIIQGQPLLNAYRHVYCLQGYVGLLIFMDEENRNLTNAKTAFNKLEEFRKFVEK